MKNEAQKKENLTNNITNPTENENDILDSEDIEDEEIEIEIDIENNKQEISFENPKLYAFFKLEKEFVDDNVNLFSKYEINGFFYFENSNYEINGYHNVFENKSLNINTVNKNNFKKNFNEVFKFTKNNEFDYSIEEELYIITGKKIIFRIYNNKNEEFLQKKKNKTIENKKKHTKMNRDNIFSHIKAEFFNNFILIILNLIITDPYKKKCLKFNNRIIRDGKKEFNFKIFNSNLEILFKNDFDCEERKHKINCSKNILINNTKNFKYKNEEFLKQLKTKEMGIKILNFKVIELFKIFLKKDWKILISKNFQIDEKELEKIKKKIDKDKNYMKKYEKICEEIANQRFFNNINEGNNKINEFHQPKSLTNLFVTKK